MGEKNPQKLVDVGVRTSLVISMRKWMTDENGQSESAAVGTRNPWLGPRVSSSLFVRTWKGKAFPTTFKTGLLGLLNHSSSQGPCMACGVGVMLQNQLSQTDIFQETAWEYWERGRKRKKKLISPRHGEPAPGATSHCSCFKTWS